MGWGEQSWPLERVSAERVAELEQRVADLEGALAEIARQDWRGHKPHCVVVAERVLAGAR